MNRADIRKLMGLLEVYRLADRDEWVSSTCPFGPYKHENGVSTRNSFGISVGESSIYHCFSCGLSGEITGLPGALFVMSGEDNKVIRGYIHANEIVKTYRSCYEDRNPLLAMEVITNKAYLERFTELPGGYRGLSGESIKYWGIRFDEGSKRVVFPIKDKNGRIVGAKGRALLRGKNPKYLLYTDMVPKDPKSFGVWFGLHIPLVPGKAIVIVEGEFDAMLLKQHGMISNVWASMGAGISKSQIDTLSSMGAVVIFFLDNDTAGQALKYRVSKKLKGLFDLYEVKDYYGCKDPGEAYEKGILRKLIISIDKII